MKAEIKAQWVAALRSGEYKQGEGSLRSGDAYCCLGVLCDLAAREGVGAWRADDDAYFTSGEVTALSVPPRGVVEWAGLPSDNPEIFDFGGASNPVAALNDTGHTFGEIADLIEAQL